MAQDYVIARTWRKSPTLQHRLLKTDKQMTACGIKVTRWPWRAYQGNKIPFMLCLKCEPQGKGMFK